MTSLDLFFLIIVLLDDIDSLLHISQHEVTVAIVRLPSLENLDRWLEIDLHVDVPSTLGLLLA